MIPVDQEFLAPIAEPAPPLPSGFTSTLTGQRLGDCVRACVASVLELHREEVPHFIEQPGNWVATIYGWLANRGLDLLLRAQVTAPVRHLCPFRDEVDDGEVTVRWQVDGQTLELHALRAYLDGWAEHPITHEELTWTIQRDLSGIGVSPVEVESTWTTAGMAVRVVASHPEVGRAVSREPVNGEGA